ncbi:hypothetical protein GCM10025870_26820 [Agromyces marinus]|uniref:ABC transporter permease n=1 Tax=Agromyces marinus TaxID=1389020 RepID=A0ABN6YDY7_9MICO|nr:hypothetical protein [Agromyces marinus]BDZ55609.1 hypothetical protein GCM10025870_26820 [Agromyces marinus]
MLVLRAYPIPLTFLVGRMARRTGLVPFLGAARALRDPAAGLVPVLAVVVGTSVAVASTVVLSTLDHGIRATSEHRIGADVVIAGGPLTGDQLEAMSATDGVAALAPVYATTPVVELHDGRAQVGAPAVSPAGGGTGPGGSGRRADGVAVRRVAGPPRKHPAG